MSRKLLFFAAVAITTMLASNDCFAQGRRPMGRLGQALGLGWGHGNHWQSPMIRSSYYFPYSEHNTPKFLYDQQDDNQSEMPAEYLKSGEQTEHPPQPQAGNFRSLHRSPNYEQAPSNYIPFRNYQPHTPVIKKPISHVDQFDQDFELPSNVRNSSDNRLRRYQPRYPDF